MTCPQTGKTIYTGEMFVTFSLECFKFQKVVKFTLFLMITSNFVNKHVSGCAGIEYFYLLISTERIQLNQITESMKTGLCKEKSFILFMNTN